MIKLVIDFLTNSLGYLKTLQLCCKIMTEIIESVDTKLAKIGDDEDLDKKLYEILDEKYDREWTYNVIYIDDILSCIILRNKTSHESHGFVIENNAVTESRCLNVSGNENMNLIFTYEKGAITEVEWNPDLPETRKRIKKTKILPDGEIICFFDTPNINDKIATEENIFLKYFSTKCSTFEYVTLINYKDHKIQAVHFDIGDGGALYYKNS